MKFMWMLLALSGISLWYIPNTVSFFSGQHSYYNLDPLGSQVPCAKCHGDISLELHTGNIHSNLTCSNCHRIQKNVQYASGDDAYEKIVYRNVTGPSTNPNIFLVTTIANFQEGNFPNRIVYNANMNVDNWFGNVFNQDGSLFTGNDSGEYAGSLSTNGDNGITYNYTYASEIATEMNGAPLDKNPLTQGTAFNPRNISWNGSAENLDGAGSRVVTPGRLAHAASLVQCADCHSPFLNNTPDDIHNAFINYGMQHNTSDNCIACHSSIAVSINWTRPDVMNIVTASDGYNITINQTYRAYSASVETFGNQSGDAIAVSNVTVI